MGEQGQAPVRPERGRGMRGSVVRRGKAWRAVIDLQRGKGGAAAHVDVRDPSHRRGLACPDGPRGAWQCRTRCPDDGRAVPGPLVGCRSADPQAQHDPVLMPCGGADQRGTRWRQVAAADRPGGAAGHPRLGRASRRGDAPIYAGSHVDGGAPGVGVGLSEPRSPSGCGDAARSGWGDGLLEGGAGAAVCAFDGQEHEVRRAVSGGACHRNAAG